MCTDEANRITSLCLDDLTGNTGWKRTTVGTLKLDIDAEIFDDHGACLYRLSGNKAVLRSEEERMADWPEDEPTPEESPTVEELQEKVTEQEEQIAMLTECLLEMSEIVYGE